MNEKMIGIRCTFECPSCGNLIPTENPFWTKKQRKDIQEPTKCGCGRAGNFTLFSLEQCEFELASKEVRQE